MLLESKQKTGQEKLMIILKRQSKKHIKFSSENKEIVINHLDIIKNNKYKFIEDKIMVNV